MTLPLARITPANPRSRLLVALGLIVIAVGAHAQTSTLDIKPAETKPCDVKPATPRKLPDTYETLYLTNRNQQNDLNEIQTAMRNLLPLAKIYGDPGVRTISIWGTAEDVAFAKRILADLDKKKSSYRLTFTLTETEGGKHLSAQTYSMIAVAGEKTELKQGSRVPIETGSTDSDSQKPSIQFQYIDVGLSITATLDVAQDALQLRTKIEQSAVADEKSGVGAQDPVLRESRLEGTSTLTPGKELLLGSVEMPGSTHHWEVAVVAELVK
jgi:type II secretory pathway component GspD/PulD (secretin)